MSSGYPPYGGTQGPLCQRCQAPLLPNEANCRNCGYYNAAPVQNPSPSNSSWGNFSAQPPQGQSGPPSWGQFPPQPAMQPPQAQNFANPPSAPSQQMGGRNFLGAPAQPSSPMQGTGYAPDQYTMNPPSFASQRPSGTLAAGPQGFGMPSNGPVAPISRAPYGIPPAGFQQYGAPPSGFQQYGAAPVPGQSFPGTGPFDPSRPSSAGVQPFSTASSATDLPGVAQPTFNKAPEARRGPKPWVIVVIVLLVLVLGGGGFAGYTYFSKHATTTVTPTVVVTNNAAKNTPLFADTFKDNVNKWSLQADPGKFSISLAANALVLEDDNNELLWEPLPGNKTFGDFTLSVDAMLVRGDVTNGYGIYVRGSSIQNSEMATYYRFELYGDGSYAIFKGTVDANGVPTSAKLVDYTLNAAIQKQGGTLNHITLTAKGSTLSLTVNGQLVKTITDSSYANGAIAPFVSNMQNAKPGAQAKFENLSIYAA